VAAIEQLRRRDVSLRFVTNTTRRARGFLVERLRGYGIAAEPGEVFSAVMAGRALLEREGIAAVAPFVSAEALVDLAGLELIGGTSGSALPTGAAPEAVLVGDLGEQWTPALLNEAFRYVMDGARLIALQRGRYWHGPEGIELDAGAWVAALEYATERDAVVCGKPNPAFFQGAVASLGPPPAGRDATVVMVGDDLWSDIQGAQRVGLKGWLVRTGKFREDVLASSGIRPDRVIDSVTDLGREGG
jgi:HAD superfamily hydrolase (TIGR01458 family)